MKIEIGKKYKTTSGEVFNIEKSFAMFGKTIFLGRSEKTSERFIETGRHWNYWSAYSPMGFREINDPKFDLISEAK